MEQGGLAPWPEVVKEYMRYAMSVENRWGNTKFLLSQLVPGKDHRFQSVQRSRSYSQILEILGISDVDMVENAKQLDHILNFWLEQNDKLLREQSRHDQYIVRDMV